MISIDDLADTIFEELTNYKQEVDDKMQSEIDKMSKDVLNLLKTHPNIPERTGKYKKYFAIKKLAQGQGYKKTNIYNKHYRLTHLLEDGHLTRNGTGRTRKFPHWKDAQALADELPKRMMEV